jgi:putative endonuclease
MGRLVGYHAGLAAEEIVAADYARRGLRLERRRWRGKRGEIDLIVREEDRVIFVEVKKSREFARAAESLSYRQMQRILGAAEEFVAGEPKGLLTEMRFDVALVDAVGRIEILENACLAA